MDDTNANSKNLFCSRRESFVVEAVCKVQKFINSARELIISPVSAGSWKDL